MDVKKARRQIIRNNPHLVSLSDSDILNFNTDMKSRVKECKIHFSPVQASGTPAPDNVLPINGWSGITVNRAGVNVWGGEKLADDIVVRVPGAVKDTTNKTVTYAASNINGKTLFEGFKPNTQYTVILNGTGVSNLRFYYSSGNVTTLPGSISGGKAFKSDGTRNLASIMGEWNTGNTTLNYDQCGVFEGSLTVSDFTPYIGTTYPVTFPAMGKNLFDKANANVINGYITGGKIVASTAHKTVYIPCNPNTTYVCGNSANDRKYLSYADVIPAAGVDVYSVNTSITTGANAKYLCVYCFNGNSDTCTFDDVLNALQIELGSTATAYEPYTNAVYGGSK